MDVTVTAALIVRNEYRCIRRCLDSICNIFDEVIIVDTGSSDGTLGIINDYINKKNLLFQIEWAENFSHARNFAIDKASSDYIFFIDADEHLKTDKEELLGKIKKHHANKKNLTAFCPEIINHDNNSSKGIGRIFRNDGDFFYAGFVHEELRHKSDLDISLIDIDIVLFHDGYESKIVNLKNKIERNNILNNKNIKKEPFNLRWHYFYFRDNFSRLDPNAVCDRIISTLKIKHDKDLQWENITICKYTFPMLDLLANALLITLNDEVKFKEVIRLMRKIIPFNSNALYYELIYDIAKFKSLAKERIRQIIEYNSGPPRNHDGMIHSEGLHLDAALAFYLFEVGLTEQSEKLLRSISDNGFTSEMTRFYFKYMNSSRNEAGYEH